MLNRIKEIRLSGIAAAVSSHWMPLTELAQTEEEAKLIRKFIRTTGVKGRYNAGMHQTTADFCYAAACRLLEEKHVDPEEIGVLVFVSQTPDYRLPATACVLQKRLGLGENCIAFDVNLGCSGFTCGINIATSLLQCSDNRKALLLAGDTLAKEKRSDQVTKTSHSAAMLFGDSGTAALLEKCEDADPIYMRSRTDGGRFRAIIRPYGGGRNPVAPRPELKGTSMDDVEVFNFACDEVPVLLQETMDISGASADDYDCLVLHQANLLIMKQIAKHTGFPLDKTLVSLDVFGNTSSASIPISLVKKYGEMTEKKRLRTLMCGFGVGLSWSTVDCFLNQEDILPLIHTDEYFLDGYTAMD